ncbi:MAG: hypothetical protein WCK01_02320 [Candidatus Uhrbacteria bacterium]
MSMNNVEEKSNLIIKALAILGSVMLGLSGVFLFIQFRSVKTSVQAPVKKEQAVTKGTEVAREVENGWENAKIVQTKTAGSFSEKRITFFVECKGQTKELRSPFAEAITPPSASTAVSLCMGEARLKAQRGGEPAVVLKTIKAGSPSDVIIFDVESDSVGQFNHYQPGYLLLDFFSANGSSAPIYNRFNFLLNVNTLELKELKNVPVNSQITWGGRAGAYFEQTCLNRDSTVPRECITGDVWGYDPITDRAVMLIKGFVTPQMLAEKDERNEYSHWFRIESDKTYNLIEKDPNVDEFRADVVKTVLKDGVYASQEVVKTQDFSFPIQP